jgi:hypothetical protein
MLIGIWLGSILLSSVASWTNAESLDLDISTIVTRDELVLKCDEELKRADALLVQGRLKDAESLYRSSIETRPWDASTSLTRLFQLAKRQDADDDAAIWLRALQEYFPDLERTEALAEIKDAEFSNVEKSDDRDGGTIGNADDQVQNIALDILDIHEREELLYKSALAAVNARKYTQAESQFQEFFKTFSNSAQLPNISHGRAKNFVQLKSPTLSSLEYARALKLSSQQSTLSTTILKETVAMYDGRRPDLVVYYSSLLGSQHQDFPVLARALGALGKIDLAIKCWRRVAMANGEFETAVRTQDEIALLMTEAGDHQKAVSNWKAVIEDYGKNQANTIKHAKWENYLKLRSHLDGTATFVLSKLPRLNGLLSTHMDSPATRSMLEYIVVNNSSHPEVRNYALSLAKLAHEKKRYDLSEACALIVLDNSGDRTSEKKPRISQLTNTPSPANVRHRHLISTPPGPAQILEAVTILGLVTN